MKKVGTSFWKCDGGGGAYIHAFTIKGNFFNNKNKQIELILYGQIFCFGDPDQLLISQLE